MCLFCFYRQQDYQRKTQTCIFLLFRGSDLETVARACKILTAAAENKNKRCGTSRSSRGQRLRVKGPLIGSRSQLCGSVTSWQSVGNDSKETIKENSPSKSM